MSYSPDKESITVFLPKGSRALLKAKRKKAGHKSMNSYCTAVLVPELVRTYIDWLHIQKEHKNGK